ncbi:MAG: asparaginase, partial [Omnitrophica WOR_2 bacterium]
MTANPFMVGGPSSFDTRLMEVGGGRILCKGGAEGFQALGILPGALGAGSAGLGIAIKISDGDLASHTDGKYGHARPAVALEALRQLGILNRQELQKMEAYGPEFDIHNWRKLKVGQGQPVFQLVKGA